MKTYLFILIMIFIASCGKSQNNNSKMKTEHKFTNHLIHQTSPYLLQHSHNPVNWYPWGEEALKKAKDENKLLLISIGYSACHWCHVMEHESFENEEVAKVMNQYFVCIKVDREERPDIDQIYMNAVQLITGQGGWPLNCFALPDARPVFGGTYFKTQEWISLLKNLHDTFTKDPERFETAAQQIIKGMAGSEFTSPTSDTKEVSINELSKAVENWSPKFDEHEGGNKGAPKFPMPVSWDFLLEYSFFSGDSAAKRQVTLTLDKMAAGGIYDHVGGGFARYSVDEYWKVPHFEKMLYDNSQLVSLYAKAYKATKNEQYKQVVNETLHFVSRELTSPEDAFYASLDADSDGEEGKFYVWKQSEIDSILGDDSKIFCDFYSILAFGNWEYQKNIPFRTKSAEKVSKDNSITQDQLKQVILKCKKILLKEREKRVRPGLDDKILTSWNSLMIKAYADAYAVFKNPEYLEQAEKSMAFLTKNLQNTDGGLHRTYKEGESKINAFLDDYALFISAQIALYQVTFNEKYLFEARKTTNYVFAHFFEEKTGFFFYVSNSDTPLIARKKEITDNVIPASNSVMAENLRILGIYFQNDKFENTSKKMIANIAPNFEKSIPYFGKWATVAMHLANPPYEVVLTGDKGLEFKEAIDQNFRPDLLFAVAKSHSDLPIFDNRFTKEGNSKIYVCQKNTCKAPTSNVEEAKLEMPLPKN